MRDFADRGGSFTATGASASSPRARGPPGRRAAQAPRPARRDLRRLHVEAAAPRPGPQPAPDGARAGRAARTARGGTLMARFLAYTSPARGHLYPVIRSWRAARAGTRGPLRTLASEVEPMRARGFDAAPIAPAIERIEHDDFLARTPMGAQKRACAWPAGAPSTTPRTYGARSTRRPGRGAGRRQRLGRAGRRRGLGWAWASWCPYPLRCRRVTRRRSAPGSIRAWPGGTVA